MNWKIVGEIIGFIAIGESFLIYFSQTRQRMLLFKLLSDTLWLLNFLCIGGYTGALLNTVGICRELVFYNRDRSKICGNRIWLPIFLIATLISPIVSMISGAEGLYALLPAFGSAFAVIGFYQKNPRLTRRIGFFAQLLWLIYAIFVQNYSSIVCNAILIASTIAGELRAFYIERKKKEKNEQ